MPETLLSLLFGGLVPIGLLLALFGRFNGFADSRPSPKTPVHAPAATTSRN